MNTAVWLCLGMSSAYSVALYVWFARIKSWCFCLNVASFLALPAETKIFNLFTCCTFLGTSTAHIYSFQRHCAPSLHVPIPKNGPKKGQKLNKKRQKLWYGDFKTGFVLVLPSKLSRGYNLDIFIPWFSLIWKILDLIQLWGTRWTRITSW